MGGEEEGVGSSRMIQAFFCAFAFPVEKRKCFCLRIIFFLEMFCII